MIGWLRKRTDERRAIRMCKVLSHLELNPGLHGVFELSHALGYRSGVLYPTLSRLLEKELIVSEWVEQPGSLPSRRMYRAP